MDEKYNDFFNVKLNIWKISKALFWYFFSRMNTDMEFSRNKNMEVYYNNSKYEKYKNL